jgi:hypothetical protein
MLTSYYWNHGFVTADKPRPDFSEGYSIRFFDAKNYPNAADGLTQQVTKKSHDSLTYLLELSFRIFRFIFQIPRASRLFI